MRVAPQPSDLAFVRFVSVENMMGLIPYVGVEAMLTGLVDYIEADFARSHFFDKRLDIIVDPDVPHDLFGMLERAAR